MLKNNHVQEFKRKSVVGVVSHTFRTLALQLIALIATFLLSGLLSPDEFGIFFTVSALVNLFVFMSDIGLAASLIQKKDEPNEQDLNTTFIVQQLLSIAICLILIGLIPVWRDYLRISEAGIGLLYALAFSFPLASLKTIPSILLERELNFNKLVFPQIIENLIFYTIVVFLAWKGWGVKSYTYAIIARGLVGVMVIYALKPWKPTFRFSRKSFKSLARFGLLFQMNDLLARVKDDLLIIIMNRAIGSIGVGYLGWSKKWSLMPFRFTVDSIVKVTFPAYSRLQNESDHLKIAIEKSLFFIALIVFPLLLGMAGMAYPLTILIPAYSKWQPALPALYWFVVDVMISAITVPIVNALNALGMIDKTLKLMIIVTSMIWILVFPLISLYDFTGVAIATALATSTSIISFIFLRAKLKIEVLFNIGPQLLSGIAMIIFLLLMRKIAADSVIKFISIGIVGVFINFSILLFLIKKRLFFELGSVTRILKS